MTVNANSIVKSEDAFLANPAIIQPAIDVMKTRLRDILTSGLSSKIKHNGVIDRALYEIVRELGATPFITSASAATPIPTPVSNAAASSAATTATAFSKKTSILRGVSVPMSTAFMKTYVTKFVPLAMLKKIRRTLKAQSASHRRRTVTREADGLIHSLAYGIALADASTQNAVDWSWWLTNGAEFLFQLAVQRGQPFFILQKNNIVWDTSAAAYVDGLKRAQLNQGAIVALGEILHLILVILHTTPASSWPRNLRDLVRWLNKTLYEPKSTIDPVAHPGLNWLSQLFFGASSTWNKSITLEIQRVIGFSPDHDGNVIIAPVPRFNPTILPRHVIPL